MKNLIEAANKFKLSDDRDEDLVRFKSFEFSGFNLIDEVNALKPGAVLDAGCGRNFLKGKINNLIGFDVINYDTNDITASIEDLAHAYALGSIDVILALGNLQYDTRDEITLDIATLVSWLKIGGIMIVRAQLHSEITTDRVMQWQATDIKIFSEMFNLSVIKGPILEPSILRHVWWWKKNPP